MRDSVVGHLSYICYLIFSGNELQRFCLIAKTMKPKAHIFLFKTCPGKAEKRARINQLHETKSVTTESNGSKLGHTVNI